MVRAPAKTCPNLSRLFDDAEPELLAAFLRTKAFERLDWLEKYRFDPADPSALNTASEMLRLEKKDKLGPLETEAARIVTIAGGRGQFALDGLTRTKLESDRTKVLVGQRDELARSLW